METKRAITTNDTGAKAPANVTRLSAYERPTLAELEAENLIIAAGLHYGDLALVAYRAGLRGNMFYNLINGQIFDAQITILNDGRGLDYLTLTRQIQAQNPENFNEYMVERLSTIGKMSYKARPQNILTHVETVIKYFKLRQMAEFGERVSMRAYDPETLQDVNGFVQSVGAYYMQQHGQIFIGDSTKSEQMARYADSREKLYLGQTARGTTWGYEKLNTMLGLQTVEGLALLGAQTGYGKTSGALSLMLASIIGTPISLQKARAYLEHSAGNDPVTVYISCEMSKDQLYDRLIGMLININPARIEDMELSEKEFSLWNEAIGVLHELPFVIVDEYQMITREILTIEVARRKLEFGALARVFIDGLWHMEFSHYDGVKGGWNKQPFFKQCFQHIQNIYKLSRDPVLGVPIVAMIQLKAEALGKKSTPTLKDFAWGVQAVQIAPTVIAHAQQGEFTNWHILKHRKGLKGKSKYVSFIYERYHLEEL